MAFPVVAGIAQSSNPSNTTTHTVNLPANIAEGDLLIAQISFDNAPSSTWPGGWTRIEPGAHQLHIAYKRAGASEPASISVTSSASEKSATFSWRITGHHATSDPSGDLVGGKDANPNPGNEIPPWGTAEDVLWIASMAIESGATVTAYPTNYTGNQRQLGTGTAGTDARIAAAERNLNASEENPGPFTISASSFWNARTIAVRPAAVVANRRGQVSWGELETPAEPRRGQATWAELETPSEPRRGLTSWLELETPDAPRRAQTAWAELEAPDEPRRGQVTWAELETPDVTAEDRRALATWVELEVPSEPRRARTAWTELETPNEPRRGLVTWAEIETPSEPRRGLTSWSELEVPGEPRRGAVSWAEFELSDVVEALRERWGSLYL
jgi:hypothetical protein